MPTRDLGQKLDLEQICAIAARLSKDAAVLSSLGLREAAHFLRVAEAELDSHIYGDRGERARAFATLRARRVRRGKARATSTH